jgi:hypothetical protein
MGLRNFFGDHTASAQASIILDFMQEHSFESNFNCSVGNNTTNNDKKLVKHLKRES